MDVPMRGDSQIEAEVRTYLASQRRWPGLRPLEVHVEDGWVTLDLDAAAVQAANGPILRERLLFITELLLAVDGVRMVECRLAGTPADGILDRRVPATAG